MQLCSLGLQRVSLFFFQHKEFLALFEVALAAPIVFNLFPSQFHEGNNSCPNLTILRYLAPITAAYGANNSRLPNRFSYEPPVMFSPLTTVSYLLSP